VALTDATLLLVRHGQSQWNVARRIQGQTADIELSELGHQQAARVAEQLLGSGATRVLSSDLTRARQTAAPIAAALGVSVQLEPGLREQSMGTLEGTYSADVWKSHPEVDWTDADHRFHGAESRREVFDRMAATLTRVAGPQPTVLVSHGDAIRLALGWLAGRPAGGVPWHDIPNCSITRVTIRSGQLVFLG
jgi:2,3-bisphosphoglycerate-dependent phosphoglycerate mutase